VSLRRSRAAVRPETQGGGAARPEEGDERGSGPDGPQGSGGPHG
jgi:hypothetical protein